MQSVGHRCSSTHLYPGGSQCLWEAERQIAVTLWKWRPSGAENPLRDILDRALQVTLIHHAAFFKIICSFDEKGPEALQLHCTPAAWAGALASWLGASWKAVRVMTFFLVEVM